jgi:hypothetical protein
MGCSGMAGIDYGIAYNIMAWDIMAQCGAQWNHIQYNGRDILESRGTTWNSNEI